jgi:2-isopropylmalate synthase
VNLALNWYTQGISPGLDFSDLQHVIDVVTQCNDLPVHPRHPYAGELVFTAFSGSHQDAIKKGFEEQAKRNASERAHNKPEMWDMPYLPIDPADLGQNYEAVIRVNSQSGKGGIAYIVKQHLRLDLPRKMQVAFYQAVQAVSDREAREMTVDDITNIFRETYRFGGGKFEGRLSLRSFRITSVSANDADGESAEDVRQFDGAVSVDGVLRVIRGDGNGPLSALLNALRQHLEVDLALREYSEHSIDTGVDGENSRAASYIELVPSSDRKSAKSWWGVGVDRDIAGSGLRAVLSAANLYIGDRQLPELKLNFGPGGRASQTDVASTLLNTLGLELPRRLQAAFFEVVQRAARSERDELPVDKLPELFKQEYGYDAVCAAGGAVTIKTYTLDHLSNKRVRLNGEFTFAGEDHKLSGLGNGPLSSVLACLHEVVQGTLAVREYSEHALGAGSEVGAVSYVELGYEVDVDGHTRRSTAWGVSSDEDITASGLKAVMASASRIGLVWNM